jgi:hypothetical protein
MATVGVRFVRPYPPYNAGEVAGFPASVAEQLLARRLTEQGRSFPLAERVNLPKPYVAKHVEGEDNFQYGGLDALGDATGQV